MSWKVMFSFEKGFGHQYFDTDNAVKKYVVRVTLGHITMSMFVSCVDCCVEITGAA